MATIRGNVITNTSGTHELRWLITVNIDSITTDPIAGAKVHVSSVQFTIDYAKITTSYIRLTANSTSYSLFDGAITGTWPSSDIVLTNDTGGSAKIIKNQNYTILTDVSHSYASKSSAYTQKINFKLTRSSGNWVGTTTATQSVDVPALPSYTVTLNKNSGSGGSTSVTATYNSAMPAITVPTKTGWTFQGYYDTNAATGGTQYYTAAGASARAWNKTSAATLYARWSRSITFKHGKSNASSNTATQYYGGNVTPPFLTSINGWTALGWRDDTTAGAKEYGANNTQAFAYTGMATTLYGVYARVLTLSYTNGGGSGNAPTNTTATQYYNSSGGVSTASFTLAANTFTAPTDSGGGWAFSKWGAGAAGASWSWAPGVDAGRTNSTSAVWTRTITFKSGVSSATSKTATQTRGSNVTVPSGTTTPSTWTLLGWRTDTTATTATYTGSSFLPAATTLYAVYSRTLTLSYTNGGGTGTAPANSTATQYYNSGGKISDGKFTLRANTFTRAGYYFTDWNKGKVGDTLTYTPAVDNTAVSTGVTARWTAYKITLTYNVNGGEIKNSPYKYNDTTYFKVNNNLVVSSTTSNGTYANVTAVINTATTYANLWNVGSFNVTRTGYHIDGADAYICGSVLINQDDSETNTTNKVTVARLNGGTALTADISKTLSINWKANTYTVTLNKNNGSGGTDSVTATYNSAMPAATMPTRTGYIFNGYYDATSGGTQYYTAAGASTRAWNKTSNTTLYAQWTERTATLTYNNSGLSGSTVPSAVTMKYTTATTLTAGTAPSGYSFYGWATSDTNAKAGTRAYTGTQQYKAANVVPSAATLYAVWYGTVTYNANGHGTAPSATTMYYTSQPKAAAAISATGYTFNGWNTKADGSGTSYTAGSSVLKNANEYKANYTLYAKWTANTYTVTLNKNGGTGGTSSVTATYDAAMPAITKPTRAGYVFQGYYDAESGGTQYYTAAGASARAWNKASATTLYAHWSTISDFTSGDYTFHVIATEEVQATATDKTKTTYGPIPTAVTKDGVTLNVTSIDNCFNGCNNLTGDIFVSHAAGILKSYSNVFSTTNPIYILATNSSVDHNVWKSVANQKTNVNYLSTDDEYSYIVNTSTHKYSIKAVSTTKTSYGNPKSTLSSATTWTADSMANCFQGCKSFNTSPTIPNTITNMDSCFQGCTSLVNAPTIPSTVTNMNSCFNGCNALQRITNIPANVTTMANCFNGCYSLRGNIKVNNKTVTSSAGIFTGAGSTQNQIYIINGLGSDSTLASTWRAMAATNDNVHYEIDDLNLSNATFTVKRQIYTDNTTESINGYVGAYINSSFNLLIANIKNMPEGWTINWSSTKPVEKMGTTSIGNINGTSKDTTTNKLYFNDAIRFLVNNNENISVTNYYTITSTDNITFSKAVTYSAELSSTSANKKIIDAFYKDSDYIYTVIDNSSAPKKVAAYAFNRSKISYSNIPSTITVDGINYSVTSLYYPSYNTDGTLDTNNYIGGCFEGCSAMTTAPESGIPSTVVDARNCFKNCSKLTGNIVVNGNPSNYDNIFTGTVQSIYIINGGNSSVPNLWRSIIAKQYTNVHFEGDDNAPPIVSPILVSRGNYQAITVNNEQVNIWTEDDTDVWVKLDITPLLQKTALPRGWENTLIKKIYIIFDDDIVYENPGERFVIEGEIIYKEPQSKTLSSFTDYYTKDTHTLVENPTQEALNNGQYHIKGYNPNKIIIYFKAVKGSNPEVEINYQTNVKVSMRDFFRYPTPESSGEGIGIEIVYAAFVMIDFLPGGHGMAIGQASSQEGLEIGLPVLIGEKLVPPYENDVYIPTQDHIAQAGKTYYKYVNNEYIIVENPNTDTTFAELEEYYEKVTAIDLNSRQLVIGKYNISDNSTKDALFVVGNGTNINGEINRSNILVVNNDSIISTGPLTAKEFIMNGLDGMQAGFRLTTVGTVEHANMDMGWSWANIDGAGAAFRSTKTINDPGNFIFFARKKNTNDEAVYTQLIGTPGASNNNGILTWGNRRVVTSTDATAVGSTSQPVYVDADGRVQISNAIYSDTNKPTVSDIMTSNASTVNTVDPITGAYIGMHASNKTFGLPAAAIKIEYSTNGGSSWTDYGATDAQKRTLFDESRSQLFYLGKKSTAGAQTTSDWLRITIEPTDRYVRLFGMYIWMTTSGNTVTVDLERSTIGAKDTFTTVFTGQLLQGWSGANIRYFPAGTFGGGSTQTSNNYKYRMTFKNIAVSSNTNYRQAGIYDIRFLGDAVWTSPNNMVMQNHAYTYDADLNVTFPAQVTATRFNGAAATTSAAGLMSAADKTKLDSFPSKITVSSSAPSGGSNGDLWFRI